MNTKRIVLIIVIAIAILLRFYQLADFPRGFHNDEAAFGYNAYSLLLTGRDEFGVKLPLFLRSFNDYKLAVYSYITIIPVFFLGLTELSVRFATAFFGVLTILGIYLLIKKYTNNYLLAILTALVMVITPWHINLSRGVSEATVAATLMIFGFLFLSYNKRFTTVTAAVLFIISLYTYHSSRVFLPIFILLISLFLFRQKQYFFLSVILIIMTTLSFIMPGGGARFRETTIFSNNRETQLVLEQQVREDGSQNIFLTRYYHNKGINYFITMTEIIGKYLSYNFLLSDKVEPLRQRIPQTGLLFYWQVPFILYALVRNYSKRTPTDKFFTYWLLVGFLPLIVVFAETPSIYRSMFLVIPLCYFTASGLISFFSRRGRVYTMILILIIAYEFTHYLHQYYVHSLYDQPWYRRQGMKEMVQTINKNLNDYDKVIITRAESAPHIFILFYGKYNPIKYWQEGSPMDLGDQGFGKYVFSGRDCPSQIEELQQKTKRVKILYVDSGLCKNYDNNTRYDVIYRSDHTPVFNIVYD